MGDTSWNRCTTNQNRYLITEETSGNSYFLPISFHLEPSVSIPRLKAAVLRVVAAEEAINVFFKREAADRFLYRPISTPRVSFREEPVEISCDAEAVPLIEAFVYGGPGPLRGAPCKIHIVRLRDGRALFTVALHHAVADALSLALFMDRLSLAYADGESLRRPDLPKFFEVAHRYMLFPGEWNEGAEGFWKASLAAAPGTTGQLPLVLSTEGSALRRKVQVDLGKCEFERVSSAARGMKITTFEFVLSAYLLVLARQTGAIAACAAFQSAGRREKPLARDVIGVFSNALPVLAAVRPEATFQEFAFFVRSRVRLALRNESMPYHEIIRATGYHPCFGMNWYPVREAINLGGERIEAVRLVEWQSDFDLNLHCLPIDNGLTLNLSFRAKGGLPEDRARTVLEHVVWLMKHVDFDEPTTIRDITLPGPTSIPPKLERARIASSVHAAFAECVASNPDSDAVLSTHGTWSYSNLAGVVDKLAAALSKIGVGTGSKVAVQLERGPWFVAALLAANKLDAVFAIYDIDYPQPRIELMDSIFGADVILSAARGEDAVEVGSEGRSLYLRTRGVSQLQTVCPPPEARYALFTSGTAGKPKCVLVSAHGLLTFTASHIRRTEGSVAARFALIGGLGHDPILRDIFTPILSGGILAIPPRNFRETPRGFARWLRNTRINVLHLTPQMSKLIAVGAEGKAFPDLLHIVWGGDTLRVKDAETFLGLAPNAEGWNLYGTTETPQAAALFRITSPIDWTVCPIGRGVNGRKVEIAQDGRMAGFGEVGDIVVKSSDLALGYYDASQGLSLLPGQRDTIAARYATGDRGFFLPSGDIAIVGRSDDQVKVRGYRVDLSEIVRFLEELPGVGQAAVLCESGPGGENELTGYLAFSTGALAVDDILAACRRALPSQMVPREIVALPQLPLTPNGKLDRDRLPGSAQQRAAWSAAEIPQTETERLVVTEIARTLDLKTVPLTVSVRDLGVDSLSFLSVSLTLEKAIGVLPNHWDKISLRDLAALKTRRGYFPPVETPVLMRAISIAAIVAEHFHLIPYVGATSALFFVAGHSFGRFQAPVSAARDSVAPILKFMGQIALPTLLYTLLVQTMFHELTPATWFFVSNYVGPNVAGGFSFWFVEVLLQNLAILLALFALPATRRLVREHPFETAIAFTLVASLVRVGLAMAWETHALDGRVTHEKLWLMGLGWSLAACVTWTHRALAIILAATLFGLELLVAGSLDPLTLTALLLILAFQRVRLPYPLNVGVTMVAAASLFIYLTHFQFLSLAHKLPEAMASDWLSLLVALLGGVLVQLGWERAVRIARSLWNPGIPALSK